MERLKTFLLIGELIRYPKGSTPQRESIYHSRVSLKALIPVLLFFLSSCAPQESELTLLPGETRQDRPVPEFASLTLEGDTLRTVDFEGKVTLVNFWATWCGPCVIETPELVGIQEEWKDRPFQVVGVSMDETGFEVVAPFAEDFMINYPQIIDHGPLAEAFGGVYAMPTTFLVEPDGTIHSSYVGIFPLEERRDFMDSMLKSIEP